MSADSDISTLLSHATNAASSLADRSSDLVSQATAALAGEVEFLGGSTASATSYGMTNRGGGFFGPFFGTYAIVELDQAGYQYSLVSGPDRSYLWILARTPTLPPDVMQRLLAKAAVLGFDTGKLIVVDQQARP